MEYINGWTKETVIEHVKKEFKGKSYDCKTGSCLYRSPEGKKCIAGCFIPDDKYTRNMEGNNANSIKMDQFFPFKGSEMNEWQHIHDTELEFLTQEEQLDILLNFLET